MADFSPFLANHIARWLAGEDDMPSAPAAIFLGLFDGNPLNGGTEVGGDITDDEPRMEVTPEAIALDGSSNVLTSDALIDFGTSESASPLTVSHWALFDHATAGNPLIVRALAAPRTINENDHVRVQASDLTVTIEKAPTT